MSDWYKANKGRLNLRRRDRMRNDPEYRERVNTNKRASYRRHRDKALATNRKYLESLSPERRNEIREWNRQYGYEYRKLNKEKIRQGRFIYRQQNHEKLRQRWRRYVQTRRDAVFKHYAGGPPKCVCCGENTPEFLTIDHINGRRKGVPHLTGIKLYVWLIKNNFPAGFAVMCYNCNCSYGFHGYCPHRPTIIRTIRR